MPTGVPHAIMSVSITHMLFIISIDMPSAGIIVHFMPLSVMEQVMWHIIGIIDATGIELPDMGIDDMDMGIDICAFIRWNSGSRTKAACTIAIRSKDSTHNRCSFRTGMKGAVLIPVRTNNRTGIDRI